MPGIKIHEPSKTSTFYHVDDIPDEIFLGIFGKGRNDLDYSIRDGTREMDYRLRQAEQMRLQGLVREKKVVLLNQVHGDKVLEVNEAGFQKVLLERNLVYGHADALVTSDSSFALVIVTADCYPIFFVDLLNRCLGAAHAGWKGTQLFIAAKTLGLMQRLYGTRPESVLVYILPGICKNAYEVSLDVANFFPDFTIKKNDKLFVDLQGANMKSLMDNGVRQENIFYSRQCTFLNNDIFFSHRRKEPQRNLNLIYFNSP